MLRVVIYLSQRFHNQSPHDQRDEAPHKKGDALSVRSVHRLDCNVSMKNALAGQAALFPIHVQNVQ